MKIAIIFTQFFTPDGSIRKVGGVETYIEYLSYLSLKLGHIPIIYQLASSSWSKDYNGIKVIGIKTSSVSGLYCHACKDIDVYSDLLIFASDFFSVKIKDEKKNIMSIQHGIWWDIPKYENNRLLSFCARVRDIFNALRTYNHTHYRVCVDYNFYNWFKTILPFRIPKNIKIIPNFTKDVLSDDLLKEKMERLEEGTVNIIFARRFVKYRGTIVFAHAISEVLEKYHNLNITIAGEGPCEEELKNILSTYSCVQYTKYDPKDTFKIHFDNDIAVIPTLASEGTSLSLIEAMGAGCLVVATPVGGMSNVIINNHNGIISMPDKKSLVDAIEYAIIKVKDIRVRQNAIASVKSSFSLETWENEWTKVLNKYSK